MLPSASKLRSADTGCPESQSGLAYFSWCSGLTKLKFKEVSLKVSYGAGRTVLMAGVFLYGAATPFAQSETTTSSSTPGQAIPGTQGVSQFAGSVPAKLVPGVLPLSLQDAIHRGLNQNLGALLSSADIRSARGQRWEQLSSLLPHVTASPYVAASEINLPEVGLSAVGGVKIPPSDGPFSYLDAR